MYKELLLSSEPDSDDENPHPSPSSSDDAYAHPVRSADSNKSMNYSPPEQEVSGLAVLNSSSVRSQLETESIVTSFGGREGSNRIADCLKLFGSKKHIPRKNKILAEPFLSLDASELADSVLLSGFNSSEVRSLEPAPLKARLLLEKLGLTRELLVDAGVDYDQLIKIIAPTIYRLFSQYTNYSANQLKILIFPFVGEEAITNVKIPVSGRANKFIYYFNTRAWPHAQSLLYKSKKALSYISALSNFLMVSGLISEKAWTFLLFSLQVNELVYYIKFYDQPKIQQYYNPFTFDNKARKEKILSRSLSQTSVWVSVFALPLLAGLISARLSLASYQADPAAVQSYLDKLQHYKANGSPRAFIKNILVINAISQAITWNGNLSNMERLTFVDELIDFNMSPNIGLLRFHTLRAIAKALSGIHVNDFKSMSMLLNLTGDEEREFYQTLLKIKSKCYQTLENFAQKSFKELPDQARYQYVSRRLQHQITKVYASYLLWEAGFNQPAANSASFWLLRAYVFFTKYTLLIAGIDGAQYLYDFYKNKALCEEDSSYWRFFEAPPSGENSAGYYCSPCPDFPVIPKMRFTPQECVWGLFNFSRTYEDLVKYLDAKNSPHALKNWKQVYDLSFDYQNIRGNQLAKIMSLIGEQPKDLDRLALSRLTEESFSTKPRSGILLNQNAAITLANWLRNITPRKLQLRAAGFDGGIFNAWVSALPENLSIEYLELSSQGSNFSDAGSLTQLLGKAPRLQYLDISSNGLTDYSIAVWVNGLVAKENAYRLRHLYLNWQQDTAGTLTFSNATLLTGLLQHFPELETLAVSSNRFSDSTIMPWVADLISTGGVHPLKKLSFSELYNEAGYLGFTDASLLTGLLQYFADLEILEVDNNAFNNEGITAWAGNMTAGNLTHGLKHLYLGRQRNMQGKQSFTDAAPIANLLRKLFQLQTLDVSENGFTNSGITSLTNTLMTQNITHGLTYLDLGYQKNSQGSSTFSDAKSLGGLLDHLPNLQALGIEGNGLTGYSISAWAESLSAEHYGLKTLALNNQRGPQSIPTFTNASALKSLISRLPNLAELGIERNGLTDESISLWAKNSTTPCVNTALQTLYMANQRDLNGNPSFTNAASLGGLLQQFSKLRVLGVGDNGFTNFSIKFLVGNLTSQASSHELLDIDFSNQKNAQGMPSFTDASLLAELLKLLLQLKTLTVGGNGFTDVSVSALIERLEKQKTHHTLNSFDVGYQQNSQGTPSFTKASLLEGLFQQLPQLQVLRAYSNGFTNADIAKLSDNLCNAGVTYPLSTLDLSDQQDALGNPSFSNANALVGLLRALSRMTELDLNNNNINDSALADFSKALVTQAPIKPALWILKLQHKDHLALHTPGSATSLQRLNLELNNITKVGARLLCSKTAFTGINTASTKYREYTFLAGNPIGSEVLEVCAVTNGASQLDMFGLFSKLNRIKHYARNGLKNHTTSNIPVPRCVGAYCDDFQMLARSAPFEIVLIEHGIQSFLFSAVINFSSMVLQSLGSSMKVPQNILALSLSVLRFGLNYSLGFRGPALYMREALLCGLSYSLKAKGVSKLVINQVTSTLSMLLGVGMFILQLRDNNCLQLALLTGVTFFSSWAGNYLTEEMGDQIGLKTKGESVLKPV